MQIKDCYHYLPVGNNVSALWYTSWYPVQSLAQVHHLFLPSSDASECFVAVCSMTASSYIHSGSEGNRLSPKIHHDFTSWCTQAKQCHYKNKRSTVFIPSRSRNRRIQIWFVSSPSENSGPCTFYSSVQDWPFHVTISAIYPGCLHDRNLAICIITTVWFTYDDD